MAKISIQEFEYQFKSLYKPLCLFALHYMEQLDDAEDVVQQTFTEAWDRNCSGYEIKDWKAYLFQSVKNRSLSFVSKQRVDAVTDQYPDIEDTSEEDEALRSEREARLWNVIDQLPVERRKIFLLAKRDGLKYQEIAEELGISIKTVENQMGKALKTLREMALRIYMFFFC